MGVVKLQLQMQVSKGAKILETLNCERRPAVESHTPGWFKTVESRNDD